MIKPKGVGGNKFAQNIVVVRKENGTKWVVCSLFHTTLPSIASRMLVVKARVGRSF